MNLTAWTNTAISAQTAYLYLEVHDTAFDNAFRGQSIDILPGRLGLDIFTKI